MYGSGVKYQDDGRCHDGDVGGGVVCIEGDIVRHCVLAVCTRGLVDYLAPQCQLPLKSCALHVRFWCMCKFTRRLIRSSVALWIFAKESDQ